MESYTLKELEGKKVIQEFGGGRQSKRVQGLEGNIVAKHFSKFLGHEEKFRSEVDLLNRLGNCPFVPKIFGVNYKEMIIYMTYMGEKPKKWTSDLKRKVQERLQFLKKHYQISRMEKYGDYLPRLNNVAILNNEVNLIDFGPPFEYRQDKKMHAEIPLDKLERKIKRLASSGSHKSVLEQIIQPCSKAFVTPTMPSTRRKHK